MTTITGSADPILTVAEVAAYLRVSKSQVYALIKRGEFPHVRVGDAIRVRQSQLERYLAQQAGPGPGRRA